MARLKIALCTVFTVAAVCSLLLVIWDDEYRMQWVLTGLVFALPALALFGSILNDEEQSRSRYISMKEFWDDNGVQ